VAADARELPRVCAQHDCGRPHRGHERPLPGAAPRSSCLPLLRSFALLIRVRVASAHMADVRAAARRWRFSFTTRWAPEHSAELSSKLAHQRRCGCRRRAACATAARLRTSSTSGSRTWRSGCLAWPTCAPGCFVSLSGLCIAPWRPCTSEVVTAARARQRTLAAVAMYANCAGAAAAACMLCPRFQTAAPGNSVASTPAASDLGPACRASASISTCGARGSASSTTASRSRCRRTAPPCRRSTMRTAGAHLPKRCLLAGCRLTTSGAQRDAASRLLSAT
jgi:hypothetical protein